MSAPWTSRGVVTGMTRGNCGTRLRRTIGMVTRWQASAGLEG